jgi:hypothetical protein
VAEEAVEEAVEEVEVEAMHQHQLLQHNNQSQWPKM